MKMRTIHVLSPRLVICPAILLPSPSFLSVFNSNQQIPRLAFENCADAIQNVQIEPCNLALAHLPDGRIPDSGLLPEPVNRLRAFLKYVGQSNRDHTVVYTIKGYIRQQDMPSDKEQFAHVESAVVFRSGKDSAHEMATSTGLWRRRQLGFEQPYIDRWFKIVGSR